jgi:hypothetical protein
MERFMEQLEYLIHLLALTICKVPGILFIFIAIAVVCCFKVCSSRTFKGVLVPIVLIMILALIGAGLVYYMINLMI